MIDHLSTYAIDYVATKRFYDAVLPGLGYPLALELVMTWNADWPTQRCCAYGENGKPTFWVIEAREKATPRHIAFRATSRTAVSAFHRDGLAAGAGDHGAPGLRPHYHPGYYGAFLLDPDSNNVEAVCRAPE
jgi:catechol 2,3-dioxygenase-like lactoylglutathione lyase family enzyme